MDRNLLYLYLFIQCLGLLGGIVFIKLGIKGLSKQKIEYPFFGLPGIIGPYKITGWYAKILGSLLIAIGIISIFVPLVIFRIFPF